MLTVSEAKILIETVLAQRARETNGEIPMTEYVLLYAYSFLIN